MDSHLLQKKLEIIFRNDSSIPLNEPEVYYFALGYVLKSVFAELGGIDQYRNEFNYLTNPYITADIQTLSYRILLFFKKIKLSSKIQNKELINFIDILLSAEALPSKTNIGLRIYETAFYAGLHSKN
jgi:hypothetical protein